MLLSLLLVGCSSAGTSQESVIEVVFDGVDCIVSGPTELPSGEVTTRFVDQTDLNAELWLVNLDEGKTIQDQLDLQSEPGVWFPKPDWVHYDSRVANESQEQNGNRIDTETWDLSKVGEHNILCYVSSPEQLLWFAAPVYIVE